MSDRSSKACTILIACAFFVAVLAAVYTPSYLHSVRQLHRGHLVRLRSYFEELRGEGWEVILTSSPAKTGLKVEDTEIWIWKARQTQEAEYREYAWILLPADGNGFLLLESVGISADQWWVDPKTWTGKLAILLPASEGAMEAHKHLGLPLPDDCQLGRVEELLTDLRPLEL